MIQITKLFAVGSTLLLIANCMTRPSVQTVKLVFDCDKKNDVFFEIDTSFSQDSFCISWGNDFSACFSNEDDTIHIGFVCYSNRNSGGTEITLEAVQNKLNMLKKICQCSGQSNYEYKEGNLEFPGYLLECQSEKSICVEYLGYSKEFDLYVNILSNSLPNRRRVFLNNINRIIGSINVEQLARTN